MNQLVKLIRCLLSPPVCWLLHAVLRMQLWTADLGFHGVCRQRESQTINTQTCASKDKRLLSQNKGCDENKAGWVLERRGEDMRELGEGFSKDVVCKLGPEGASLCKPVAKQWDALDGERLEKPNNEHSPHLGTHKNNKGRCRWHHPYGRMQKGTKKLFDENERGEWKSWLKTQHSKN